MKKIGLNELRKMFQDFYESKGHYPRKSFSLVPEKDKSLLLINSGMAPLKPYFAGIETPPSKRMVTCQKCIRTGDIENVGYTARHATFFEMLGSFSFGDYFKTESIQWGWEFIREVLEIPESLLWVSVYEEDDEAYNIWKDVIGIDENKIVRLGKDDNFWEIGIGPCGPCSEIYYDRGEKYGCDNPDCKPGCECDRYIEFWNHVFTQYNRDEAGNYTDLPNPNIDTGMGLERLACMMQEVDTIFEVDTIQSILNKVVEMSGTPYGKEEQADVSIRIVTDHIRSVIFLISDGVLPSNEGRGYVLRRLLRRAARHGKTIGIEGNFMAKLAETVIDISKGAYPELEERKAYIQKILTVEEERFSETIDAGNHILAEYMEEMKQANETMLSGEKAFKLYDTYGFPIELTKEILEEKGYQIDQAGFEANMQIQKENARSARKATDEEAWAEADTFYDQFDPTTFLGYAQTAAVGTVLAILKDGAEVTQASAGEKIRIILNQTPFYAESGGQISDTGTIQTADATLNVMHCEKHKDVYVHECDIQTGKIKKGDTASLEINILQRNATARNHTATHLLHKALREVLGNHVEQAGSLVTGEKLRFDFTHFESISKEDLRQIENQVNYAVNQFLPVYTEELTMEDALKKGAMALFDDKYKDLVRVVSVGDYSVELCGGTHVRNAGQIGALKIISETGVAAGVRRIEAITGSEIASYAQQSDLLIAEISELLKAKPDAFIQKLANLLDENKAQKKELDAFKKASLTQGTDDLISSAIEINNAKVITKRFEGADIAQLRDISDQLQKDYTALILVFASVSDDKAMFMISVTDDLLEKGFHAGNLIKQVASIAGGGGGGKANMAQAGAKNVEKVDEALKAALQIIANIA